MEAVAHTFGAGDKIVLHQGTTVTHAAMPVTSNPTAVVHPTGYKL
jgi:hypothetical protein